MKMWDFLWKDENDKDEDIDRIMIIDPDEDYLELLERKLKKIFPDCVIDRLNPGTDEMPGESFPWENYDVLMVDYYLGHDSNGLDLYIDIPLENRPATIMLTGRGSEQVAVIAMKLGVDEYLVKESFTLSELESTIRNAFLEHKQNKISLPYIARESTTTDPHDELVLEKGNFYATLESFNPQLNPDQNLALLLPENTGRSKRFRNNYGYLQQLYMETHEFFNDRNIECNITIYKNKYIAILFTDNNVSAVLSDLSLHLENENNKHKNNNTHGFFIGALNLKNDIQDIHNCFSVAVNLCKEAGRKGDKINIVGQKRSIKKDVTKQIANFNMSQALRDGRVKANYQPWVYIANDESINVKDIYDVRIDLIDNEGKYIEQNERIYLFQDGLETRVIDRWIVKECVNQLSMLGQSKNVKRKIKFAIKLTAESVADPKFLSWCNVLLLNSKLSMGGLIFEIDANSFIDNSESATRLMKKLRGDFDVKFVLSGIHEKELFSEVSEKVYFDYVKINIQALSKFGYSEIGRLVNEIKARGSMVIAINIETADILSIISGYAIDYIHGFLVEKPKSDVLTSMTSDVNFEF